MLVHVCIVSAHNSQHMSILYILCVRVYINVQQVWVVVFV